MPCRDDYPHQCPECKRKHISDMSDADLLAEIEHRKAVRKADVSAAVKRKKEIASRDQRIKTFINDAEKKLTKIAKGEIINVVVSEEGKTEIQSWKRGEFATKFEAWLRDCKPMPSTMQFEKATIQHGRWFLHSWHTHD